MPREYVESAWTPENLQTLVDSRHPDVVVSCGWPNLTWLPRANVPVGTRGAFGALEEKSPAQWPGWRPATKEEGGRR